MTAGRRAAIGALLFVYVAVRAFWWVDGQESTSVIRWLAATGLVKIAIWVVPALAVVIASRRVGLIEAARFLGLEGSPSPGLRFGLAATLPLLVIVAASLPVRIDPLVLVGSAVVGPFAEEVLFRGFLQKHLLSSARWPAAWAIGVSAIMFGAAHAADDDLRLIGSVYWLRYPELFFGPVGFARDQLLSTLREAVTMTAGGVVFGWIFYRFRSLWPAIAFHGFLNLWLTLSYGDGGPGPMSGIGGIAQIASFALAVILTLRRPALATSRSPVRLS